MKVSQDNSSDDPIPLKVLRMYFNFTEYPDIENPGVKQYDELNKKDLTGPTYYSLFTAPFFTTPGALKDNMPSRFVKASC